MNATDPGRPVIETMDLTRTFRRRVPGLRRGELFTAVDRMSFTIAPGESVGYIGANGAGKSTTIKMLTGIPATHVRHAAHLRARPDAPAQGRGPAGRRGLWPAHAALVGTCPCTSRSPSSEQSTA